MASPNRRTGRHGHKHDYSVGPNANVPRSMFDRTFTRKQTLEKAGFIYPFFADFMFPGDVFKMRSTFIVRMATPIHPLMDGLHADVHYWVVPCRILWKNWIRFMGAQDDPADSTDYTIPQVSTVTGYTSLGLGDYLGLPIGVPDMSTSALWHRAYNKIWNWGYRNQNLSDSLYDPDDDGPDDVAQYGPRRRQKRGDYFTTCLPWPQKGDAVSLPLGTEAPVLGIGTSTHVYGSGVTVRESDGTSTFYQAELSNINSSLEVEEDPDNAGYPHIRADLQNATGATINELRQAAVVQRILERDARSGTRITEVIFAQFRVTVPDYRAQQPEYVGGGSFRINASAVPQTSSTDATTPQGNLGAFAVGSGSAGFTYSAVEHMVVLGLISVRADITYQQGIPRQFLWKTRYDFYTPDMQGLGEQTVQNQEIFAQGSVDPTADISAFGYQERFAELRTKNSEICGLFRSDAASSLHAWHLAQDFANLPTLNETFIQETPPIERVVAVPSEPHFWMDSVHSFRCARPLGTYGTPGINRL